MYFEPTIEEYHSFIAQHWIAPYEETLKENLRKQKVAGLPASVLLLSKPCCRGNCYQMSILLTTAMSSFHLVHGNINCLPKEDYPNHSWVEKDGYVYDTTDALFEPEILKIYDEQTVQDYPYYQAVLQHLRRETDAFFQAISLQYLELLELEQPTVNHHALLEEIEKYRSQENLKTYAPPVLEKFRQYMNRESVDS